MLDRAGGLEAGDGDLRVKRKVELVVEEEEVKGGFSWQSAFMAEKVS